MASGAAFPPSLSLSRQRSRSTSPPASPAHHATPSGAWTERPDPYPAGAGAGAGGAAAGAGGWIPPDPVPLSRARSRSDSPPATRPGTRGTSKSSGGKGGEAVKVFARVRPPSTVEVAKGEDCITYDADGQGLTMRLEDSVPHSFRFNRVFTPESAQEDVYHHVARPLIDSVLSGFNAAIIAYGQTGSGKTHTMMGPDAVKPSGGPFDMGENRGLIPRMLEAMFDHLALMPSHIEFEIRCSFLEIYLENVVDLLQPKKPKLEIKDDGFNIRTNAAEVPVVSVEDVMLVMDQGNKARATASTDANHRSSRSHAIFQVKVFVSNLDRGTTKSSQLYLVDLAGSERADKAGTAYSGVYSAERSRASADRMKEAQKINSALFALGNVISALTGKYSGMHIPYRNSKLTHLLRTTFGGNSKTALVVNVSPSTLNGRESLNTLRFGAKASSIKNLPKANQQLSSEELRRQLAQCNVVIMSQVMRSQVLEASLVSFRETALKLMEHMPSALMHQFMRHFPVIRTARQNVRVFAKIPVTLLAHILTYADGRSMAIASGVCKKWRKLASTERIWKLSAGLELPKAVVASKPDGTTWKAYFIDQMSAEYRKRQAELEEFRTRMRAQLMGEPGRGIKLLAPPKH